MYTTIFDDAVFVVYEKLYLHVHVSESQLHGHGSYVICHADEL